MQRISEVIRPGPNSKQVSAAAAAESLAPMLATPATHLPRAGGWAFEFKWDGMRALAAIDAGVLRLISRTGRDLTAQFPELHGIPETLGGEVVTLDGELVVLSDDRPSFAELQPRMHLQQPQRIARAARQRPALYLIFDLLRHGSEDLTPLPYQQRRERLERLELNGPHWSVPPMRIGEGAAVADAARRLALEGVIAKRLNSPYRPGIRSRDWLKVKLVRAQEFVIGGWRPSRSGRTTEIGSLVVGYYREGGDEKLTFAGLVGTGFSREDHRHLLKLLHARRQAQSPFVAPPPAPDVRFVRPDLVAHVAFTEWTPQQVLRQPAFKGLREDKPAREVVRET